MITQLTTQLVQEIADSYGTIRKLNLSHNEISKIESLELLPGLTELSLASNKLLSEDGALDGLSQLSGLKVLDLSHNTISTLGAFEGGSCSTLEVLSLSSNAIGDMREVERLKALPALRSLELRGNPVCALAGYRGQVLGMLPGLDRLDGRDVEGQERRSSLATVTWPRAGSVHHYSTSEAASSVSEPSMAGSDASERRIMAETFSRGVGTSQVHVTEKA
ncbi:unnamed protein product, partial [Chrysoparadoxa australica]